MVHLCDMHILSFYQSHAVHGKLHDKNPSTAAPETMNLQAQLFPCRHLVLLQRHPPTHALSRIRRLTYKYMPTYATTPTHPHTHHALSHPLTYLHTYLPTHPRTHTHAPIRAAHARPDRNATGTPMASGHGVADMSTANAASHAPRQRPVISCPAIVSTLCAG